MSKSNIINKLKLFSSIANSDIQQNSFDSFISNTDDPIDFLLDLIKITIGENILETVTENALRKIINQKKLNEISDSIYDEIGSGLSEESPIPQSLINNGITMPVKSFDISDSFRKTNITGSTASKNQNIFFQQMTSSVLVNPNVDVALQGIVGVGSIIVNYNETLNEITAKLPNINQKDLFNLMRTTVGPLLDADIVVNEILKILFHTNFTKEDAQMLTLVRSYTKYENKDIFKLDLKKLLDLELDTEKIGINIDTSCFKENIEITQQQINDTIQNISIQSFNALVPQVNTPISSNLKNDYHKNLLKAIIEALLMIILKQPGIVFIINLIRKILDINVDLKIDFSISEFIEKLKVLWEKIFDNIYNLFFCEIFNFIKKYIIRLVITVTIKFLREQLEKRTQVLSSLSRSEAANRLKSII